MILQTSTMEMTGCRRFITIAFVDAPVKDTEPSCETRQSERVWVNAAGLLPQRKPCCCNAWCFQCYSLVAAVLWAVRAVSLCICAGRSCFRDRGSVCLCMLRLLNYCYITCVFAGRLAQPAIVFSSNDLQLTQQAVAANLSANPYFLNFVNSHIPEDTPELAQLRKYVNQGSDVHQS